jgi:hypothetical protein
MTGYFKLDRVVQYASQKSYASFSLKPSKDEAGTWYSSRRKEVRKLEKPVWTKGLLLL